MRWVGGAMLQKDIVILDRVKVEISKGQQRLNSPQNKYYNRKSVFSETNIATRADRAYDRCLIHKTLQELFPFFPDINGRDPELPNNDRLLSDFF